MKIILFLFIHHLLVGDSTYSKYLNQAKIDVISQIQRSKTIDNKSYLIQKINDIKLVEFYNKRTDVHMFYYLNIKTGEESINVNTFFYDTLLADNQFYHELNHLIQHHTENKPSKDLINKFRYDDYVSFFASWRDLRLTKSKNKNKKPINIGKKLATTIVRDRFYYLSDKEVEVRFRSLYHFLHKNGILQLGEEMEQKHLIALKSWVDKKFTYHDLNTEIGYFKFLMHDFVLILPLINLNNIDKINHLFR